MKKPAVIAAVLIPLAAALVFFGRHPDFPPNELTSLAAETSRLHRYAESPKPDIALMDKTYREGPRRLVRWVDTALDVEMDDKITAAFDLAGQGSIPIINAQIAALTVTRVFWEYLNLHTDWPAGHDRFVEAFAAFDEWLERADAWVGDGGIFAKTREAALAEGSAASALALAREVALVNLLAELDLMEQRLEDRPEAALVHEARGLQFLHILYQDISRKNREDAVYVMGEFRDHPKDVDTAEIRTRLKKLFGAEVRTIGESTFDRRGVALNDVFAP